MQELPASATSSRIVQIKIKKMLSILRYRPESAKLIAEILQAVMMGACECLIHLDWDPVMAMLLHKAYKSRADRVLQLLGAKINFFKYLKIFPSKYLKNSAFAEFLDVEFILLASLLRLVGIRIKKCR